MVKDFTLFSLLLDDFVRFAAALYLLSGKERRRAVCEVAAEVYERIAQTTDVALKFNDTYDPGSQLERSEQFAHDLSALGEALALRIELEDRVIGKMLAA